MDTIDKKARKEMHDKACVSDDEDDALELTAQPPIDVKAKPFVAYVGNTMLGKVAPWYFAKAFAL